MRPTPKDWPRISSSLYYDDPKAAIDWLCKAFGFELRLLVEHEGVVQHSELTFGGGVIMIAGNGADEKAAHASPTKVGGKNTQNMMVYVDDVVAHHDRALAAGAIITQVPSLHDYGEAYWADRSYGCTDVGGHGWWFAQRVRG